MAEKVKLSAKPRQEIGKQAAKVRKQGLIPAVLYGAKTETVSLSVDRKQFQKAFAQAGESTLVELDVEGLNPKTVLVHDVQYHYLNDEFTHIDFYEVDLTKKIHARIPLTFVGDSKAVKDLGGVLVKNISEVEVESLPADLPHHFEVDVSGLNTFEDSIKVSDFKVDHDKVKVLADMGAIVAKVAPPRSEEELKALEEKPVEEAVEEVEGVVKEEKKEGEEEGVDKPEKAEKEEKKSENKKEKK